MANIILHSKNIPRLSIFAIVLFIGTLEARPHNHSDSLISLAYQCKNDSLKSLLLGEASYQTRLSNHDTSFKLAELGYTLASKINFTRGKAINLRCMAINLFNTGQIDSAYILFHMAEELAQKANWDKERSTSLNYLGELLKLRGLYARSAQNYFASLRIREKLHDTLGMASSLCGLSEVFYLQKSYAEARQYLQRAELLIPYLDGSRTVSQIYLNLAKVYLVEGKYYPAEKYSRLALLLANDLKAGGLKSAAYNLLGESYLLRKKPKEALNQFRLALPVASIQEQAIILNNLARSHLALNQSDSALHFAKKSQMISKIINAAEIHLNATEVMIDAYRSKGEFKMALDFHTVYDSLTKILFNEEKLMVINQLAFEYDSERRKEKIKLLEKEKAWQTEQVRFQKRSTMFSLLAVILLILVTAAIVWALRKYKEANKTLISQKEAIQQQSADLQESNAAKDKLFSIISHDVLGPIARLKAVLSLVKNAVINKEEFINLLPQLYKSADHVHSTLENLLHWSSQQIRGYQVNPSTLRLRRIVQELEAMLGEQAKEKSIMLVNEVPQEAQLHADENHLKIILRNLMTNAIKFTKEKGVVTVKSFEQNSQILIQVVDTGKRMSEQQIDEIFKLNKVQSSQGTAGEKGTGLGLILCKELIEANGGTISLSSENGKGTSVTLALPAYIDQQ